MLLRCSRIGLVVGLLGTVALAQGTWWVDAGAPLGGNGSAESPFKSIQQAIDAAAANAGDTVLVRPGTYYENIDFKAKWITVESELGAAGQALTTIHGSGGGSVVLMSGDAPVLLGFTVENGSGTPAPPGAPLGGGIQLRQTAQAWVVDCTIRGNYAERGGGVGSYLGGGTLVRCLIEDNQATTFPGACTSGDGGGVLGPVSLVLRDCTVRANRAINSGGGVSGCTLENGLVEENVGARGAGLSQAIARGTTLRANRARSCDDGLAAGGGADSSDLEGCVLIENDAWDEGGGARQSTLVRCRLEGNAVTAPLAAWGGWGGGALDCDASDSSFVDNWVIGLASGLPPGQGGGALGGRALRCVFRGNRADIGAGTAYADLDRCVVYANHGVGSDLGLSTTSTIAWANTGGSFAGQGQVDYCDVEGGWPGAGNIDADPLFWDPAAGDFHLQPGSPCIDAGDPAGTDPDGSRTDMGAFPFSSSDCLAPVAYCAAGTSSNGCVPWMHATGSLSASATSGFVIGASELPGHRRGALIYGTGGEASIPWGASSTLCVANPLRRTAPQSSGGTPGACDGSMALDFNAWKAGHPSALGAPFAAGQVLWAQYWYRDPSDPNSTNLTDALRLWICP